MYFNIFFVDKVCDKARDKNVEWSASPRPPLSSPFPYTEWPLGAVGDRELKHYRDSTGLEIDAIVERRSGEWVGIEVTLGGERALDEAVANFGKLRTRLTQQQLGRLASFCVITGGQTSYTRPDNIHVISLGHLRA